MFSHQETAMGPPIPFSFPTEHIGRALFLGLPCSHITCVLYDGIWVDVMRTTTRLTFQASHAILLHSVFSHFSADRTMRAGRRGASGTRDLDP